MTERKCFVIFKRSQLFYNSFLHNFLLSRLSISNLFQLSYTFVWRIIQYDGDQGEKGCKDNTMPISCLQEWCKKVHAWIAE